MAKARSKRKSTGGDAPAIEAHKGQEDQGNAPEAVELETPRVFRALPVEHRAMQWTGDNYEALQAFTSGAVELESDGRTLGVHTTEGYVNAPIDHYICEDARGSFYPCDPEVHEAKYAEGPEPAEEGPGPLKTASPRELMVALRNRVGRVQAITGHKVPGLVVMAQEIREHELALDQHPALDEKRA